MTIPDEIRERIPKRGAGRPRDGEEREPTKKVDTTLPVSMADRLEALAASVGVSRSALLYALVDDLMDRSRKAA